MIRAITLFILGLCLVVAILFAYTQFAPVAERAAVNMQATSVPVRMGEVLDKGAYVRLSDGVQMVMLTVADGSDIVFIHVPASEVPTVRVSDAVVYTWSVDAITGAIAYRLTD